MLFSEPKIPQCNDAQAVAELMLSFSALQRAENSSICRCRSRSRVDGAFQCSSASRKFLNQKRILLFHLEYAFQCSSASRKFLNRICGRSESEAKDVFQCSSASRKFLNQSAQRRRISQTTSFSALQRAENSSIGSMTLRRCSPASVSVLFSEPKIPQCECRFRHCRHSSRFSALQRAENSSIFENFLDGESICEFQCSSASRKFLNKEGGQQWRGLRSVSVLFSEPKIPQFLKSICPELPEPGFSALQRAENSSIAIRPPIVSQRQSFSALQRAENSSIPTLAPASIHIPDCDDHASSFLSLPGASP